MRKVGGLTKKKLTVHLGGMLRAARTRRDWTQADVAERVGVATEVYGRMERGNLTPSVPNLRTLCLVLRMDADEALGLESTGPAEWLKEFAPSEQEESPRMRRLMRALRQLDDKQLSAMSVVARTLVASMEGSPSVEEEPSEEHTGEPKVLSPSEAREAPEAPSSSTSCREREPH